MLYVIHYLSYIIYLHLRPSDDSISSPSTLIQFASDMTLKDAVVDASSDLCSSKTKRKASCLDYDAGEADSGGQAGTDQSRQPEEVNDKKIYHVHKSFTQNVMQCDRFVAYFSLDILLFSKRFVTYFIN